MVTENIEQEISRLCQSCGFCCNGVLFTRVPLAEQDTLLITESGLLSSSRSANNPSIAPQRPLDALLLHYDGEGVRELELPCPYLHERRCTVYEKRPTRCGEFECKLIRDFRGEIVDGETADRTLIQAIELYGRLKEKLGTTERVVGFWLHIRRLLSNPDFRIPSIAARAGFDPKTRHMLEEFLAIIDEHFGGAPAV